MWSVEKHAKVASENIHNSLQCFGLLVADLPMVNASFEDKAVPFVKSSNLTPRTQRSGFEVKESFQLIKR